MALGGRFHLPVSLLPPESLRAQACPSLLVPCSTEGGVRGSLGPRRPPHPAPLRTISLCATSPSPSPSQLGREKEMEA